MLQSKLLELLRTLSPRQLSRLEEFLASPFFNKNEDLLAFFRALKPFAPGFSSPGLEKEAFLKKEKWDARRLTYWMSDLLKQAETFLTVEALLEDDHLGNRALLEMYHRKDLAKHYKGVLDRAGRRLEEYSWRNAEFFYWQFQLRQLEYLHSDKSQRTYNPHLQEAANALDTFYLVEKLRLSCDMVNLEQLLNVEYDLRWTEDILPIAARSAEVLAPAVQVYLAMYRMLKNNEDTAAYFEAKEKLLAFSSLFDKPELTTLSVFLFNFCSRRINRFNDPFFWKEYLEVGKFLLRGELIFEEGRLSPWLYKNLVTAGLNQDEPDWTLEFIQSYRDRLPDSYQEPLYEYNLAHYYYYLGRYDEAQRTLMQVEFRDVFLALSTRSLLVKIFYETEQEELLFSHLEAFRIYLLRNKLLPDANRRQVQQFIDFTRKLARIGKPEADKLPDLEKQLPDASLVLHRDWLADKIAEKKMKWGIG